MPEFRMLKFKVPVDDKPHTVRFNGHIMHVACQGNRPDEVTFWVMGLSPAVVERERVFRVFGTGQPIPHPYRYVGTALYAAGELVWHLCEEQHA